MFVSSWEVVSRINSWKRLVYPLSFIFSQKKFLFHIFSQLFHSIFFPILLPAQIFHFIFPLQFLPLLLTLFSPSNSSLNFLNGILILKAIKQYNWKTHPFNWSSLTNGRIAISFHSPCLPTNSLCCHCSPAYQTSL